MTICSRCGEDRDFALRKGRKTGLCPDCNRLAALEWYHANKERALARMKEYTPVYNAANLDKVRKTRKAHYDRMRATDDGWKKIQGWRSNTYRKNHPVVQRVRRGDHRWDGAMRSLQGVSPA